MLLKIFVIGKDSAHGLLIPICYMNGNNDEAVLLNYENPLSLSFYLQFSTRKFTSLSSIPHSQCAFFPDDVGDDAAGGGSHL
jgi:hypothetical protein